MKRLKEIITCSVFLFILFPPFGGTNGNCQNIGINATGVAPDPSALLDLESTERGLLIPRMTTIKRDAISLPVRSLLIFNTTTGCFEFYESGSWYSLGCNCTLPGIPVTTAGSGAVQDSIIANWNASVNADGYFLDVDDNSDFSSPLALYNNKDVGNNTTDTVTGLTCGITYYYRVRAYNTCGTTGNSDTIAYATAACFSCGSPITDIRDGKIYNTVLIGTQCWMAENLNFGSYAVGTSPQVSGTKFCQNLSGVNDPGCPMGGLYEWTNLMQGSGSCNGTGPPPNDACVTPVQGLCPAGWHVPSHYEFTTLEREICTSGSCTTDFPYNTFTIFSRGTNEGGRMKVMPICGLLPCFNSPNTNATNTSNFSALPGGYFLTSSFGSAGAFSFYWSSSQVNGTDAWNRELYFSSAKVGRNKNSKARCSSQRCIKN